jgi:hypothetical protein
MAKYGGGMPRGKPHNNSGGATQSKTGDQHTPLSRNMGYTKTMAACANGTRTQAPHTGKHYQYESAMVDDTGNVLGWSPE